MTTISLLPLSQEHHIPALQRVYEKTPSYWQMYGLDACPENQAERDLKAGDETPGQYMMGIVRRVDATDPQENSEVEAELIGLIDFRLHWPQEQTAYVGMVMVADPYQRQGFASQAWALLQPWFAASAQMQTLRLGVEQFNHRAMHFFQKQGFTLNGEANRMKVGERLVRLLYMEKGLGDRR